MRLQVLHPRKHIPWFQTTWEWRRAYPKRVRRWDMVTDFDQWLAMMQRRISVGVFAPRLCALVTLEPTGGDVYEVHVDVKRGINHETLLTALLSIRKTVFEQWGAQEVFAGVISRNCGIIRVARTCGFMPDGVSEQAGQLKFIRLRMTIEQYKDRHLDGFNAEYIHTCAGGKQPGHRPAAQPAVSG